MKVRRAFPGGTGESSHEVSRSDSVEFTPRHVANAAWTFAELQVLEVGPELEELWRNWRMDIWMFPKIVVSPNHPFVNRVFHYKPSSLGNPYFLETPIY